MAYPDASYVFYGIDRGDGVLGTLMVPGKPCGSLSVYSDTLNSRSGKCIQLVPSSTSTYGYLPFNIPVKALTATYFTFYHKITPGFNGSLKVTIYDTDGTTILKQSDTVGLIDNGSYNLYTSPTLYPSDTGLCLVILEVINGIVGGSVYIDDINIVN